MGQERLNDLAMLSFEAKIAKCVNGPSRHNFAAKKARKLKLKQLKHWYIEEAIYACGNAAIALDLEVFTFVDFR